MTISQDLFTAVHKAYTLKVLENAPGNFSRTLNPVAKIVFFTGAFHLEVAREEKDTRVSPIAYFDTTGSENEDLFNLVFDNLTEKPNSGQPGFFITGTMTTDVNRSRIFTYNGQLPYNEAESEDGLQVTRTIPAYFEVDVPPSSEPAPASPPTATSAPAAIAAPRPTASAVATPTATAPQPAESAA